MAKNPLIFEVRRCVNPQCGLRYTLEIDNIQARRCPNCRSETVTDGPPFAQQTIPALRDPKEPVPVEILLDNIRSAWNVGSILRAADGAGVRRVHLCGVSPTPDQAKVAKTSLGAEGSLPWEYHPDGVKACLQLIESGYEVWALEGGEGSGSLFEARLPKGRPLLLVVGNEITGMDPGILALCDQRVFLPMAGVKGSLNVAVAFGAAIYTISFGLPSRGLL